MNAEPVQSLDESCEVQWLEKEQMEVTMEVIKSRLQTSTRCKYKPMCGNVPYHPLQVFKIIVNSSVSKEKLLFDQHKSFDGLRIESCMAQRDCIMASWKNPFDSYSRSCIECNEKESCYQLVNSLEIERISLAKQERLGNCKQWPCPPLQQITSVKILTRKLEVLLNLSQWMPKKGFGSEMWNWPSEENHLL